MKLQPACHWLSVIGSAAPFFAHGNSKWSKKLTSGIHYSPG